MWTYRGSSKSGRSSRARLTTLPLKDKTRRAWIAAYEQLFFSSQFLNFGQSVRLKGSWYQCVINVTMCDKKKKVIILTGAPRAPAGPGGPKEPVSPWKRTQTFHFFVKLFKLIKWGPFVLNLWESKNTLIMLNKFHSTWHLVYFCPKKLEEHWTSSLKSMH